MVKGLTAFGVDQFANKNNRPDILLKRIGLVGSGLIGHYSNQYKKRLRRSGFSEEQLKSDFHFPEVKILETKQGGKFVNIAFELKDSNFKMLITSLFDRKQFAVPTIDAHRQCKTLNPLPAWIETTLRLIPNMASDRYCSSSPRAINNNDAWHESLVGTGNSETTGKTDTYHVRLVRSSQ